MTMTATKPMPQTTTHCRDLTAEEIATYRREGVALVPKLLDTEYLAKVRQMCYDQRKDPSKWGEELQGKNATGQFFMDRHMHAYQKRWRNFLFESGQGRVAAQATGSEEIRCWFDHLWFHAPNTVEGFPWHQDGGYWPFQGRNVVSIWFAIEDNSTIEYVRGTGHLKDWYQPIMVEGEGKGADDLTAWVGKSDREPMPDYDGNADKYEFLPFKEIKAGDGLLFNTYIVHRLPGNPHPDRYQIGLSTRFLGDGSIWDPRPGTDPIVTQADVKINPGDLAKDDAFPLLWQRGRELTA